MKYIASVSFGKDSLAMLLKIIELKKPLDVVVYYNTGMEFEAIYKIRDKVVKILKENNIQYVELKPEKPFLYSMFEQKIKYRKKDGYHYGYGWCGGSCRWATGHKLQSLHKYAKSLNDEIIWYVGIAYDEQQRLKRLDKNSISLLNELKMNESDCLNYCYSKGYDWDGLYHYLDRVSCWCCRNKNLKELKNIHDNMPEYFVKLCSLEETIGEPMKKPYTLIERFGKIK